MSADSWNFVVVVDSCVAAKDVAAWDNFVENCAPFADIEFVICDCWDSLDWFVAENDICIADEVDCNRFVDLKAL